MWILVSGLFILLALICPHWWRKITVKRWQLAHGLDKHQPVFTKLYADIDGFSLSRIARSQHDAIDYTYGEIDFLSFIALLSLAKPNHQTVFYDLGSGTGKAVLACAMVFNVQRSYGIELFESLNNAACTRQKVLRFLPEYAAISKTIHFIQGDFLHVDFNDATLVFINATGFIGQTWTEISARLTQTTRCTTVISTSKSLKSDAFTITNVTAVRMSWGVVKAYIQKRTR